MVIPGGEEKFVFTSLGGDYSRKTVFIILWSGHPSVPSCPDKSGSTVLIHITAADNIGEIFVWVLFTLLHEINAP